MEVSTPIDPDAASDTLLRAQEYFYTKLLHLHQQHEFPLQHTYTLLRNYHNNVPIFQARSRLLTPATAHTWDHNTILFLEDTLRTTLNDRE
eukprot:2152458-Prorocentrum_lima.AAC.1